VVFGGNLRLLIYGMDSFATINKKKNITNNRSSFCPKNIFHNGLFGRIYAFTLVAFDYNTFNINTFNNFAF
jgi:hypothetical protein